MKILFLVYHGFSDHSGISKKIHYQVKGLRENGHDVRLCYYGFAENGHRCRYVDNQIIKDYGKGWLAGFMQRLDYSCIYDYCKTSGIDFIYARCFQNANPFLILFFKKIRKLRIKCVTEIPTFPYDGEFEHSTYLSGSVNFKIDKLFRNRLYSYMDGVVTFSDEEVIFGQRTIRISNGVDFDSIPLHNPSPNVLSDNLHLIGVAEVHPWHGFDRLIAGIGEYQGKVNVYFHIVGGIHPDYKKNVLLPIIQKYQIEQKIFFHGALFGEQLDDVFNQCQFAIGSLARHRSGITAIKTLKNREYATRGIPFIYSEQDSDFDNQPYVIKAPADDTPIDISDIIDFMYKFDIDPYRIRQSVNHLSWKIQMGQVIRETCN